MAAHRSKLEKLHERVAEAYAKGIELDMDENIFNPALLSAAAKFLKDNEISADVKSDDDLGLLRSKLVDAAKARAEASGRILYAVNAEAKEG